MIAPEYTDFISENNLRELAKLEIPQVALRQGIKHNNIDNVSPREFVTNSGAKISLLKGLEKIKNSFMN